MCSAQTARPQNLQIAWASCWHFTHFMRHPLGIERIGDRAGRVADSVLSDAAGRTQFAARDVATLTSEQEGPVTTPSDGDPPLTPEQAEAARRGDWGEVGRLAIAADLKTRIAVRNVGPEAWTVIGRAKRKSAYEGHPLPVDLLRDMRPGDELWWYCSPDETWQHLCGRAGWAVVRDGRVVADQLVVLN